jgi:cysteine desulfurase family protein (TIGR01976 family)
MDFPLEAVRSRFPSLAVRDGGVRRIYLDNPAGTQVPASVADAIRDAVLFRNANLGGMFASSKLAQKVWEDAHRAMADLLGAASMEEIIIGPNMTSLTFQLSRMIGRDWGPGDEVIVTRMDHEGNVGPWMQIAADKGATVKFLPFSTETWQVEADELRKVLSPRTRLLALSYASNLTGSINRVKELTKIAREAGALVYVDAVQFTPHGFVDVNAIGCDFLACSAYKFFGPHMGIVWGRRAVLDSMTPYKLRCSTNDLPGRLETGTPQIELLAGLSATVDYFAEVGGEAGGKGDRRERISAAYATSIAHENTLALRLIEGIRAIEGTKIHGITDPRRVSDRVPTVSFTIDGIAPKSLVSLCNAENIFFWSGHNYAWEVVHFLGIPASEGVVRVGMAHYNSAAEVDETLESIARNIAMLRQQRKG